MVVYFYGLSFGTYLLGLLPFLHFLFHHQSGREHSYSSLKILLDKACPQHKLIVGIANYRLVFAFEEFLLKVGRDNDKAHYLLLLDKSLGFLFIGEFDFQVDVWGSIEHTQKVFGQLTLVVIDIRHREVAGYSFVENSRKEPKDNQREHQNVKQPFG